MAIGPFIKYTVPGIYGPPTKHKAKYTYMESDSDNKIIGEIPISKDNWPNVYDERAEHIEFKYVFYYDRNARICFSLYWRTKDTPTGEWSDWQHDYDDPIVGLIPEYVDLFIEMLQKMMKMRSFG